MELVRDASIEGLIQRLAADFSNKVVMTLLQKNRFTWVLSGGQTPRKLYETLARDPYKSVIPWSRLWIFWGDERMTPPDHPDSNYRMAQEALLGQVPIPSDQIFRMRGELPPAEAAREYQQQLRSVFGAAEIPSFDLILLGLGPDGHTASLFPKTPALQEKDRWVMENPVPQMKTVRLTLTLPVINQASDIWFLATGADKAAAFAHVRATSDTAYPASLVMPQHGGTLRWYVDSAILQTP